MSWFVLIKHSGKSIMKSVEIYTKYSEKLKQIIRSEPSQVNKPIPRVNLSDKDAIMMFEWAKSVQDENSDYERTGLWGLLQATQVNLTDK